jgi:argininosuccinate synthase
MREAIDALVARVEQTVTGTVRLKFWKGDCRVVGRESKHALKERADEADLDERVMLD